METWSDIVNSALVGTERRPFQPPASPGLGDLFAAQLGLMGDEAALLSAAALYTQYLRAGSRPARCQARPPEPCPADERPRCSGRSSHQLQTMLDGQFREILPEWLEAAHARGQRVPEEQLPGLLALGAQVADLRPAIVRVIGERGQWLARLNERWRYAAGLPDAGEWKTVAGPARLLLLKEMRAVDPEQARQMLQETWSQEKADDRAALLRCLAVGLSLDDEPFLEASLDDRSAPVRRTAVDLLAHLPESRFVARMIARAEAALALKGRIRAQFELSLPDELDPAAIRDGIEPAPPASVQMGAKAWQLSQLIAAVPPGRWTQRWNRSAGDLLTIAQRGDWSEALRQGWVKAATRHPDPDWILALLRHGLGRDRLITPLSPSPRERCVLQLVRERAYDSDLQLFQMIDQCRHPWEQAFARHVLTLVTHIRNRSQSSPPDTRIWPLLRTWALYYPPDLVEEARTALTKSEPTGSPWDQPISEFLEYLSFRDSMLKELSQ